MSNTFVEGGCLEWPGRRTVEGYGLVSMGRNRESARITRVVWEAVHGPLLEGQFVLHRCDNPPCYRMSHLFCGTKAENNADMHAKGRNNQPKGAENGRAKLEPDDVRAIRVLLIDGRSNSQIAEAFGIHKNTVQEIRNGNNWGWLV